MHRQNTGKQFSKGRFRLVSVSVMYFAREAASKLEACITNCLYTFPCMTYRPGDHSGFDLLCIARTPYTLFIMPTYELKNSQKVSLIR